MKNNDEIKNIVSESIKYRERDYKMSRTILEAGLEKYPDNEILLSNLLYVLIDPDEIISIASKLYSLTRNNNIKFDSLRFMAYAYKKKGDIDSAEKAISEIPDISFTKLTETAYLFEDERMLVAAEKQKWISFENLIQMLNKASEYYQSVGENEKAAAEIEKALAFIKTAENSSYDSYIEYFESKIKRLRNN